ncbi:hypothetical protein EON65_50055 [archaeon]|nr:MAG: hypothetical protein EON65_50055 [archaeon]
MQRRHERQREFLNKSAEDIAREYEERHRYEEKVKETYEGYEMGAGGGAIPIAQQSLLPKVC